MKDLFALLIYIGIWVGGVLSWLYAIVQDAKADRYVWLFLDVILPPLGVVRGFILWA